MTHLRQLMIEELQRRNFAESTIRSYVHGVEHFSQYFHRHPDRLGPQHIREYQAMLLSKLKYSPNTVISRLAALRFFYIKALKRHWSIAETPYPRKVIHLPQILSPEEVTRLIDAADSTFHRAMLMTLYATGARRAEASHLIVRCRTAALGGHRDRCSDCGYVAASYNSCGNRHCPKCQGNARLRWLEARQGELLPTRYVHAVFTIPRELGPVALQNKKVIFNLRFRASAQTLLEVAADPRHLGAEIGFFSVLHTWDQRLLPHPHS